MEGVEAVYTAEDLDVPGMIPTAWILEGMESPDHPILAEDKVRYVGDSVAVVVAEDRYRAYDASLAIDVQRKEPRTRTLGTTRQS